MGSIQPADPAARRKALWTISIVAAGVYVLLLGNRVVRAPWRQRPDDSAPDMSDLPAGPGEQMAPAGLSRRKSYC
jgi:hypothetical protein